MPKRTIKINIKLPAGVTATKELENKATQAANQAVANAVSDLVEAQKIAKNLAAQGIQITAAELISRKTRKPKTLTKTLTKTQPKASVASKGARKRVVLSDAQRKNAIADLKADGKINDVAKKYGVSSATIMNIKTKAGLTKKRK